MKRLKTSIAIVLALFIIFTEASSCRKPGETAYQKQVGIPAAQWKYDFQPVFKFNITDTQGLYAVYLIFRHDDAFSKSNLWVRLKVKSPADSNLVAYERAECILAAPDGQWLGNGMGTIWEHKILLKPGVHYPKFTHPGTYEVKLEQVTRDNPLTSSLNVGLRVERLDVK